MNQFKRTLMARSGLSLALGSLFPKFAFADALEKQNKLAFRPAQLPASMPNPAQVRDNLLSSSYLPLRQAAGIESFMAQAPGLLVKGTSATLPTLNILVDPLCPFCAQHFWNLNLAADRPDVRYILVPVTGSPSLKLCATILSSSDPAGLLRKNFLAVLESSPGKEGFFASTLEIENKDLFSKYKAQLEQIESRFAKEFTQYGLGFVPLTFAKLPKGLIVHRRVMDPRDLLAFVTFGDIKAYKDLLAKGASPK